MTIIQVWNVFCNNLRLIIQINGWKWYQATLVVTFTPTRWHGNSKVWNRHQNTHLLSNNASLFTPGVWTATSLRSHCQEWHTHTRTHKDGQQQLSISLLCWSSSLDFYGALDEEQHHQSWDAKMTHYGFTLLKWTQRQQYQTSVRTENDRKLSSFLFCVVPITWIHVH